MPAYRKPAPAGAHARYVGELRAGGTLHDRAVDSWREQTSADGSELLLWVTYTPLRGPANLVGGFPAPLGAAITDCYVFSAAEVAAMEGK